VHQSSLELVENPKLGSEGGDQKLKYGPIPEDQVQQLLQLTSKVTCAAARLPGSYAIG
jgi:hypothetical protein